MTITGVRNDGGAGPAFAMGQRGTQPLPRKSGLFAEVTGSRQLRLATPVDLVNVHFMAVVDPTNAPTVDAQILARDTWESQYYLEFRRTHLMLQGDPAAIANVTYPAGAVARLGLALAYWTLKERGDLQRGGSLRDGLVDAAFVGGGRFTPAPAGGRWRCC